MSLFRTRAFRRASAEHLPVVMRFARSLCRDASEADELVKRAWVQAQASRRPLRDPDSTRTWLLAIVYRLYAERARRVPSGPKLSLLLGEEGLRNALLAAPGDAPQQTAHEMMVALMALPHAQRAALWLTGVEGQSYARAATVCACTVADIEARVARGRVALVQGTARTRQLRRRG